MEDPAATRLISALRVFFATEIGTLFILANLARLN
jgi:hypothetical protein